MNVVYNWTKNSLTVICPLCEESNKKCELCKGSGFIEVGLRVKIINKVSPCCNFPWQPIANSALKQYQCSKCNKLYDYNCVIGEIEE